MKKFKTYLVLLPLLALIPTGCRKALDQVPYTSVALDVAFSTGDKCQTSLSGVYDAAQSGLYTDGSIRGYPFGAANIEQEDCRGEDVINIATFYQITYEASYNANSANCVGMWNALYALANKANVCIDGFRGAALAGVITSATALQYEAECRFLRAMAHHEAVVLFARPWLDGAGSALGVPYRDFAVTSSDAVNKVRTIPRPIVDTDYKRILRDLDFAEANLAATFSGQGFNAKTIRATKAAAIALKMRVKMHMGDWAGVIVEGNKLVPTVINPLNWTSVTAPSALGSWALTPAPDGPFASNATNTESIFSVKNDALDNVGVNASLATMYGAANLGARGLVSVSPLIWNNAGWRCDDLRRTALYVAGANANQTPSITSYFTTKYRDYVSRSDYAPQIRYAEVLLTLAEAEARNSGTVSQRAIDLLNTVRNRSIPNPAVNQYVVANFATPVDLVKAILLERRIEFLFEGRRWADISRLALDASYTTGGIPAKAVNGTNGLALYNCGGTYSPGLGAIPYSDFRFIWPIPADEIIQNPIISQNPGY